MIASTAARIACAFLVALFAFPVFAAEPPPPPGEPKDFKLPPRSVHTLPNGVRVTMVPFGKIPKVTVTAVVRAGNLNEGEDTWLADLTAEMLKEGAGGRTGPQIAFDAAAMGGEVGVAVGPDETSVGIDVLSEHGPSAVALVADLVQRPTFPASEFERIRRDFDRQLALSRSQPDALAAEAFLALLYPNHPYGRAYPTPEQLAAYTLEDVRRFHDENFGGARTRIYVAGVFDEAQMKRAIEEAFSGWKRGPDPLINPPNPVAKAQLALIDRPGAPQSTIQIGLPVPDPSAPEYLPLSVMNTLLGGGFSSRITANLREDKGYAYSPGSGLAPRFRSNHWVQEADVTTEATGPSIKEIFYEIERLRAEPPSAAELESVQNYRAGVFVLQNATRTALINQLSFIDLHGLPLEYLTKFVEHVYALTPEQITAIAKRTIRPDEMTIVVVGDLAKVRPQLEQLPRVAPLMKQ